MQGVAECQTPDPGRCPGLCQVAPSTLSLFDTPVGQPVVSLASRIAQVHERRPRMSLFEAIVLGLVQGLTEFLPISSTAHLTLAGKLMGLIDPARPEEWTAFIAVIQLGTLLAVIIYFWRDILKIVAGFVVTTLAYVSRKPVNEEDRQYGSLGWFIIIGTLPIAIVGLLFRHQIEGALTKDLRVIAGSLIGLAIILTIAELVGRQRRGFERLGVID